MPSCCSCKTKWVRKQVGWRTWLPSAPSIGPWVPWECDSDQQKYFSLFQFHAQAVDALCPHTVRPNECPTFFTKVKEQQYMCDHIQPTFASFIQEVCKPRLCATYLCNFVQHTVNQASRSAGEGGGGVAGPSGARLGMRIAGSDCNLPKLCWPCSPKLSLRKTIWN